MPRSRAGSESKQWTPRYESIAIERDAHFGAFGRRRAVLRIELREVGRRHGALPDRFVEPAVDGDALAVGQPNGGDARRAGSTSCAAARMAASSSESASVNRDFTGQDCIASGLLRF